MKQKKTPTFVLIILLFGAIASLDLSRRYFSGEFEGDKIEINFLYSSEKSGFLESVVDDFEQNWSINHEGAKIKVIMTPIGSGKGTIQVANGASQPTVWSPASRFWLPILNLLWSSSHDRDIVHTDAPSLVISPTIIATWKSYQQEKNITGLEDLRKLAVDDPEFTYAHTDPFESNSGFGGVIMQAAVAANKNPEALTIEDLSKSSVQQWMRELEGAVIQYGSSTGFLSKLMASEGPERLKAAIMYENLVMEKNKELVDDTLVAIYPVEGTLLNDHPYAILDAPWVSDLDRSVAQDFVDFLLEPHIQSQAIDFGFRPVITSADLTQLIEEKFVESAGVRSSLTDVKIYSIAEISGEILERIPDLWSATRSRSLSSDNTGTPTLTTQDYLVPSILIGILILMIISPLITRLRKSLK